MTKRVVLVGDSWTGGSNMNTSVGTLWWANIAKTENVGFVNAAIGGSGYVATNSNVPGNTFLTRAKSIDFTGR